MTGRPEHAVAGRRPRDATIVAGWPLAAWAVGSLAFTVLATANAGGYRYGGSDQAFYIPAVFRALDARAFPHDGPLIDAQGRFMVLDEFLAAVMRTTGASLELLFLLGYCLSLLSIWTGLALISNRVYRNRWAALALAVAFTLRHRIPRTGVNSFEPYFHPRMLAFGIGVAAIGAFLWRRPWAAVTLVALSVVVHTMTGIWFAMLMAVALVCVEISTRRVAIAAVAAATAVLVAWMTVAGPLRSSWTTIEGPWLQAISVKDSLFPMTWPAWAWAVNLSFLGLLWWAHLLRLRSRRARPQDSALVWGATALVVFFIVTLPAVTAGLALAVQLQISRIFWLVGFLATVYLIAAIVESTDAAGRRRGERMVMALAGVLLTFSVVRALYVTQIEHPERALFAMWEPESPWKDAMDWIARQPLSTHVLADPGHAWKYGTSVRVSAGRDVLQEDVKDAAMAVYSRDVGRRVVDRANAIGDFSAMTVARARSLAKQFDLDYLVTDSDLALPVAYRNTQFRVYALEPSSARPVSARR